jgi:hypothetical protein
MRAVLVFLAIASLGAGTLVAGAATAKVKKFKSKVTLAATDPFHGTVSSHKPACMRRRTVKVFHEPDAGLYDTTKTDANGTWTIPAGTPHGDFYARVLVKKRGSAAHRYVCRAARSTDVHFG